MINMKVESSMKALSLVDQVKPMKSSLQTEHVFILDTGPSLYMWVGQEVAPEEKWKVNTMYTYIATPYRNI